MVWNDSEPTGKENDFSHEKAIYTQCPIKAFKVRGGRLKLATYLGSLETREFGLNHSIYGHMNKHYLKIKYKNS